MLNRPPGAMLPESHTAVSDVDVCVIVSLLTHVIVPPRAIATGLGLYAVVVSVRELATIETVVAGAGDGEGDGVVGDELPLQAAVVATAKANSTARMDMGRSAPYTRCRDANALPRPATAIPERFARSRATTRGGDLRSESGAYGGCKHGVRRAILGTGAIAFARRS
jgi:hypothetical protein